MWRIIKGTGVDFVAKDLPPYSARMSREPNQSANFGAFATLSVPAVAVTERDVMLSLDRIGSPLVSAEFQALFRTYTRGLPTWHIDSLNETHLQVARFKGPSLEKVSRLPAITATIINSEPLALGDEALSIMSEPGTGHHLVRELRVSQIRIAVCALVPGSVPKRVLLWTQSARFRERLRFKLTPGQNLNDFYPSSKHFDDRGHSVVAVMSTLIEGASLLVS